MRPRRTPRSAARAAALATALLPGLAWPEPTAPRTLVCDGVERWAVHRDGAPLEGGERTRRWRVPLASDGTARTPEWRLVRDGSRLVGRWRPPDERGAPGFATIVDRVTLDLATLRLDARLSYRYARTPYDHAEQIFARDRAAAGACVWAPPRTDSESRSRRP